MTLETYLTGVVTVILTGMAIIVTVAIVGGAWEFGSEILENRRRKRSRRRE